MQPTVDMVRRSLVMTLAAAIAANLIACASADGAGDDGAASEALTIDEDAFVFHPGERQARADLVNAYWAARLAGLANADDATFEKKLTAWRVPVAERVAFDADVSRVTYVRTPTVAFVTFRGTRFVPTVQGVKEVLADAHATPIAFGVGHAHTGFTAVARAGFERLSGLLADRHGAGAPYADVPVVLVGHSMGAAAAGLTLALTMADESGRLPSISALYTYGMPRTADPALAKWIGAEAERRGTVLRRFVFGWDVPSQVPPTDFGAFGYRHLSRGDDENAYLEYINRRGALFVGAFDAPQRQSDVDAVVHDHDPATYVAALLSLIRSTGVIRY